MVSVLKRFLQVSNPDPHCFWKLDPDPHLSEKLDPDPHYSPNSGAFEAHNGAVDGHNRGVWGSVGQWSQIRITMIRNIIRIRIRTELIWIGSALK